MARFNVERVQGYTVMSNYHLRDNRLSMKAKGLMSVMLSLPPEWDYSLRGLAAISRENVNAIGSMVKELEECEAESSAALSITSMRSRKTANRVTIHRVPKIRTR